MFVGHKMRPNDKGRTISQEDIEGAYLDQKNHTFYPWGGRREGRATAQPILKRCAQRKLWGVKLSEFLVSSETSKFA